MSLIIGVFCFYKNESVCPSTSLDDLIPIRLVAKPKISQIWVSFIPFSLFQVKSSDNCESYFDLSNVFHETRSCTWGNNLYCCGDCQHRFCCSEPMRRLNQSKCYERCESYRDSFDRFVVMQDCPAEARFCCGACSYRDCCPYYLNRVNQNECPGNHVSSTTK